MKRLLVIINIFAGIILGFPGSFLGPLLMAGEEKAGVAPPDTGVLKKIAALEGAGHEGVSFNRDASKILCFDKTEVTIWDGKTYAQIGDPLHHGDGLKSARFDAAGDKILTVGNTWEKWELAAGEAKLWDAKTGKLLLPSIHHADQPLSDAAISPDGTLIATCYEKDRTVRVLEAATGKQKLTLKHEDNVWAVQFDPTGSTLVTTGCANVVWDVRSWAIRMTLHGTSTPLSPAPMPAISADGKRIALATDSIFEVYDLVTARKICDNQPHRLASIVSWRASS